MSIANGPEIQAMEAKEPIEYAIDHWLRLLDYTNRDTEVFDANPVMVTMPLRQIKALQMEMLAFRAGFRQGRS